MSREIRRVPAGFDWPLNTVWEGFLLPDWLREGACPGCDNGYSKEAKQMYDQWYGYAPFDPSNTGSKPMTIETPEVRAFAERNVTRSPSFYGEGEASIVGEAQRLLGYWNKMWMHHLSQDDVDALLEGDRLWDFTRDFVPGGGWKEKENPYHPTAAEVNAWSVNGFGHDSINAGMVIDARCKREGVPAVCAVCDGHASAEKFIGQRGLADAWASTPPPTGECWQMWSTVSEGSPVTPAFETADELAAHLIEAGMSNQSYQETVEWITGPGWAPSGAIIKGTSYQNIDAAIQLSVEK